MDFYALKKPFPKDRIHWRIGSTNKRSVQRKANNNTAKATKGIPLAYIDARDVMERLDAVCGESGWQCRYPFPGCCEIGIMCTTEGLGKEWIWKSNGAGETDIEGAKGQYSDAFKRAAVLWGVGQYLYGLPNEWVDLDDWGKPKKLPNLPNWALPGAKIDKKVVDDFVSQVVNALATNDENEIKTLWAEWTDPDEKLFLWNKFNSQQRAAIKKIQKGE